MILSAALPLLMLAGCDRNDSNFGHPDTITVHGSGYSRTTLTDGSVVLLDKRAVLSGSIHPYFEGFELLVSSYEEHRGGQIVTDIDGPVYILAPASPIPSGWVSVPDSANPDGVLTASYGTTTITLGIFTTHAFAGKPVTIPTLSSGTFPACPLARKILYSERTRGGDDIEVNEVQVKGNLIDARLVKSGQKAYPQNDDILFTTDAVEAVGGKLWCAVSHLERRGPEKARFGAAEKALIASESESLTGWTATGRSFKLGDFLYNVFEKDGYVSGEWVDIPYTEGQHCPMVFGHNITACDTPVFGVEIAGVEKLRDGTISNACITLLDDGSYLAACSGATGNGNGMSMYRSTDKGATWQPWGSFDSSVNLICNYTNIFTYNGVVYIMGVADDRIGFRISKSTDNGQTWTVPDTPETGYLLEGTYHTATVPVVFAQGRIWRAVETYDNDTGRKDAFVMSAPLDSDWLDASNWTVTNTVSLPGHTFEGKYLSSTVIEGNAVVLPDGTVADLLRDTSSETSAYAVLAPVTGTDKLTCNFPDCMVRMPGGGKKFTVRYDEQSKLYWSLTNPSIDDNIRNITNQGIYAGGMSTSLQRNRLILISSPDLLNWTEHGDIIYDPDPFFHGFQYVDWVFDGNDMAAVVRAAFPEYRGLPIRQHDANKFIFIKVENFRNK